MNIPALFRRKRVYVDAKILGMHDANLPRSAYVGYLVEGSGFRNVRSSKASETDDAEIDAILFAIEDLKGMLKRFTVICDHQSVVSEANKERRTLSKNPRMNELRETLDRNKSIGLKALEANLAHAVLTEFVNKQKLSGVEGDGTG